MTPQTSKPTWLASANQVARCGSSSRSRTQCRCGSRPPRFAFDFVIDESTKIITGAPFDKSGTDSAVWADVKAKVADFQKKGTLDEAKASALLDEARGADRTVPRRLSRPHRLAKEDRRSAPEKTSGVGVLPNGAAYDRERLANQTTTSMSADEIHQIGLSEVARLRGEMEAIRKEVGFSGDLRAFFGSSGTRRTIPVYYPDTDEGRAAYIKDATVAIDRIKAVLPKYFGVLPKAAPSSSGSSPSANSRVPRSTTSRAHPTARARASITRTWRI